MNVQQKQIFCPDCDKKTLHQRLWLSAGWGILLTFLTGGLFLIFWATIVVMRSFKPFSCTVCGRENSDWKRESAEALG